MRERPAALKGRSAVFCRRVIDLLKAGRPVARDAAEIDTNGQSIYRWHRQARIDAGIEPCVATAEHVELMALRRRVR